MLINDSQVWNMLSFLGIKKYKYDAKIIVVLRIIMIDVEIVLQNIISYMLNNFFFEKAKGI